jgi:hypothetical protein
MFKIENADSLNTVNQQIPDIRGKVMLVRFKMDGCVHCVNSQPIWNHMIHTINRRYRLAPHTMIGEVDSNVADPFVERHAIQNEYNQPYSVQGFPEHTIIVNGVGVPGESTDMKTMNSIVNELEKNDHIKKKSQTKVKSKLKKRKTLK